MINIKYQWTFEKFSVSDFFKEDAVMDDMKGIICAVLLLALFFTRGSCIPSYVSCPDPDPIDHVVFFPHEENCDQFYRCDHGSAGLENCPSGLHWNPKLDVCDWPWNAGCSPGNGNGGGNCDESDECPADTPPDCPNPDPTYSVFFPHPKDCHWFYHCSNGVAFCKKCPAGLLWNVNLNTCDSPSNVNCKVDSVASKKRVVKAGSCPAGETPTCPSKDPAYSVFFPHENDCHWFYHCSNGIAYCKECPASLHWNTQLDTCDWPENAKCSVSNGGGDCEPPTSMECPVPQPPYNIYFPDASDCTIFYQCSNGVAYKQTCPAGLHFNPSINVCDYPQNAGCSSDATDVKFIPEAKKPIGTCPVTSPPECPADKSAFLSHPDPHWFFHCNHGVAYCKVCPPALLWDQDKQQCDW